MTEIDGADGLEAQLDALEESLGGAGGMLSAFDGELQRMQVSLADAGKASGQLSGSISRGLHGAFKGLVFDGMKLSDALRQVANSVVNATFSAAVKPVTSHFGGLISQGINGLIGGAAGFANGGAFTQGRVTPFAKGGVVTGPTHFPMRGGLGLMGEAGPEAIMPLSRGADGKLGVRTEGGSARPVQVVMNISTRDAESFQRSEAQIAARMSRALGKGQRNR
ncbi:phage tail tape measure protein [Actibacterium sp. 188UL27-1]|uniref:phage tail tape measure protein n=1 Tax=Actibacterium sp. 188UL27-1 TaxID=2786961 RepID=UPI0019577373|nr:phage tail tape measure protein [Actibacterium sp. 188UL27-1]MBM7068032.1 phage tail tape measure protein [Actibacterium sp. 188UL27-1]